MKKKKCKFLVLKENSPSLNGNEVLKKEELSCHVFMFISLRPKRKHIWDNYLKQ